MLKGKGRSESIVGLLYGVDVERGRGVECEAICQAVGRVCEALGEVRAGS